MEQITEVVKKHPVAIGIGVLVLVLIVAKSSGSSGSASYAQSQALASQADLTIAKLNNDRQTTQDQLTASIYAKTIDANAAQSAADSQSIVQLMLGAMGYRATLQQLQDQHAETQSKIDATTVLSAKAMQTQADMHTTDVNAALNEFGQNINLQHYGIDVATQNLPALIDYQKSKDASAVSIASINAQSAQAIASTNTAAARTNADTSQINGIVGAVTNIAGLFGL